MKQLILLICILMQCITSHAQYNSPENYVWTFGENARVDFSTGSPVIGTSSISTVEGCSSVCSATGELLFYTDGKKVFNRTGAVMPSGISVVPAYVVSTTQSSVIVPFVGDSSRYYIFTLSTPHFTPWTDVFKLTYCIVDMSLDGGLGDIAPGSANTFMADTMSEKLITIAGNSCNMWLLAHKTNSNRFLVYEITTNGISAPTYYDEGLFAPPSGTPLYGNGYHLGTMKCSHDRSRLFLSCAQGGGVRGTGELYDFNTGTGAVSNCRKLCSYALYDAEFSPNNTRLYTVDIDSFRVDQYDLTLPTMPDIIASRKKISGPATINTGIRLAPDGKIYTSTMGFSTLDCIPNPDMLAPACGYTANAVNIYPGIINMGLPNLVWKVWGIGPYITGPAEVCVGDTITLYNSVPGGVWTTDHPMVALSITGGKIVGMNVGTATVFYSAGEGECSVTRTITVTECEETSVTDPLAATPINIYPIPATDAITVDLGSHTTDALCTLHDLTGRQVYTGTLSSNVSRINMGNLASGTYNCTITDCNGNILTRKLIPKR